MVQGWNSVVIFATLVFVFFAAGAFSSDGVAASNGYVNVSLVEGTLFWCLKGNQRQTRLLLFLSFFWGGGPPRKGKLMEAYFTLVLFPRRNRRNGFVFLCGPAKESHDQTEASKKTGTLDPLETYPQVGSVARMDTTELGGSLPFGSCAF